MEFLHLRKVITKMRSRFERLAKFIGEGDGLEISPEDVSAYNEMLGIYDETVLPSFKKEIKKPHLLGGVRNYIADVPRTIYMIRAILRAVRIQEENREKVKIIEAGCGSGFLASVSAALSEKARVIAFDCMEEKIKASRHFAASLGYDGKKVWVLPRDLLSKEPIPVDPDILIAEHLTRGLLMEHAARISRNFNIDPNFVIPYSVHPFATTANFAQDYEGEEVNVLLGQKPNRVYGKEVVLGNKAQKDEFHVEGLLAIQKGKSHIMVGNNISWTSPHLSGDPLKQDWQASTQATDTWWNHLLGPVSLESECFDNMLYGLNNESGRIQLAEIQISYPFGIYTKENLMGTLPKPSIWVSHDCIKVIKGKRKEFYIKPPDKVDPLTNK